MKTIKAKIREGIIEPLEKIEFPEGSEVMIIIMTMPSTTEEKDWMDDPAILELLAKREKEVAEQIKKGEFTTLKDLQSELGV